MAYPDSEVEESESVKNKDPKQNAVKERVDYHMGIAHDQIETGRYTARNILRGSDSGAYNDAKDILIDTEQRVVKEIRGAIDAIDKARGR